MNDGKGHFRDATKGSGLVGSGWGTSAAFADFDGDGVLDLFVGQYVNWTPKTDMYCSLDGKTKSYCTPERYNGVSSRLYKGLGGGKFRDITKEAGLVNPLGKALGVAVRDVDGDGRPDLVVANDTSPNNLFRNVKTVNGIPKFKDVAIETGVAVGEDGRARGAMGVAFGDTKNDGGVDARRRQLLERDVVRLERRARRATSSWTSPSRAASAARRFFRSRSASRSPTSTSTASSTSWA